MHVNNEIGVVQDIAGYAALCAPRGITLHTDAAQAVGKLALDVAAVPLDFLSFTAHKLYGPKGIGALYVRSGSRARLQPVTFGGGQERGLRPGTLPTHQIVRLWMRVCACRGASGGNAASARVARSPVTRVWRVSAGCTSTARLPSASPTLSRVSIAGVEGESLVTGLTELALSTGSACNSATGEPSYVLRALGRSARWRRARCVQPGPRYHRSGHRPRR